MNKTLGEKITAARISSGLSQNDVADFISKKGLSVTNQKVSKWETNYTIPNAYQFLALCEALNISDVLGTFGDTSISSPLSKLNEEGKKKVDEFIKILIATGMFNNETAPNKVVTLRNLPLYDLAVSAGTGKYLDSDTCVMVEVGSDVPMAANFGVRISGDSMEPRFVDGQIVWVHQQPLLNDGEIGIFSFENNSYCKKLSIEEDSITLISLNPNYPPIEIPKNTDLKCFGKVVG